MAVVAVAYGTAAPELGTAEFAPAGTESLEAPPSTAGDAATERSGRSRRTTTTPPPASETTRSTTGAGADGAPTTRVGRSRQCYGNPPRQIEDPQGPPCLATIFEGDNGGATTRGVTQTDITVAIVHAGETQRRPAIQALFDFFNTHFELYGRRLVPVMVTSGDSDPVASRATAADIANQRTFAAVTGIAEYWDAHRSLYSELARQHLVTVTRGAGTFLSDRLLFDEQHPYAWSVYPSSEEWQRNVASFVCTSLAGGSPSHSPDPDLRSKATRKFGVIAAGGKITPAARPLVEALAACGLDVPVVEIQTANDPNGAGLLTGLNSLKAAGVTTMVCVCEAYSSSSVLRQATTAVGFRPEWMISPTYSGPNEGYWQGLVDATGASVFGVMDRPRLLPKQAQPWFQMIQATNPQLMADPAYSVATVQYLYEEMLVLASGIQAAGPNLTPETFAAALLSLQFPNPGAGQAPYWQPSAGFGPGDHSFFDDFALAWWDRTIDPLDPSSSGRGSWCYVDRGARFATGRYPTDVDAHFFNPAEPCR